jgi:hypothetical protein
MKEWRHLPFSIRHRETLDSNSFSENAYFEMSEQGKKKITVSKSNYKLDNLQFEEYSVLGCDAIYSSVI